MAVKNTTIMSKAWLAGSNDFQQRVPNPTQAGIKRTMTYLFDPMNRDMYNQFVNVLVNRIVQTYVRQTQFENPLGVFKKGMLPFGSSVEEVAVNWLKAHAYDDESGAELLKLERPEAAVWFHTQNREDKYAVSVSRQALKNAFLEEYGLNNLIAAIIDAPRVSDNYDEYRIMMQLIAEYTEKWSMYTVTLPEPNDEATGKAFLTEVKALAGEWMFPKTAYTPMEIDVPVVVQPSELVLFVTPRANASLDVNTLASVFQLDKAELQYRKVIVDEFPVPDMYAMLTTDAFFQCFDTVYETAVFWNPDNLTNKHYLHHWGIYSCSPFVPCVAFRTSAPATVTPTVTQTTTGLMLAVSSNEVAPGGTVQLTPTITGSLAVSAGSSDALMDRLEVAPDAATYAVSAARTTGSGQDAVTTGVQLNSRTFVDRLGVLHVQRSDLKEGDVITIVATSTYTNPSGDTTVYTATKDVTVSQDSL